MERRFKGLRTVEKQFEDRLCCTGKERIGRTYTDSQLPAATLSRKKKKKKKGKNSLNLGKKQSREKKSRKQKILAAGKVGREI